MRRRTLWTVVAVTIAGCAHRQKEVAVFAAGPVTVTSPTEADKDCIERLLARSRLTGYVEQTVDRQAQFFRVAARHRSFLPFDAKRGRPLPYKTIASLTERGLVPAEVEFYGVQCIGPETAVITPMGEAGPLSGPMFVMDLEQRQELNAYAASIGLPIDQ